MNSVRHLRPCRRARCRDRRPPASGGAAEVAEREHHLPVLARIGIRDRGDLVRARPRGADRPAARRAAPLGRAGLRRRRKLGPRQIDLEEFVGHHEPAARIAVEQMMAAGEPEVLHRALRAPCAECGQIDLVAPALPRPRPPGNENAASAACRSRGCSVRNASRISPSSAVRCTAISVRDGCRRAIRQRRSPPRPPRAQLQ